MKSPQVLNIEVSGINKGMGAILGLGSGSVAIDQIGLEAFSRLS